MSLLRPCLVTSARTAARVSRPCLSTRTIRPASTSQTSTSASSAAIQPSPKASSQDPPGHRAGESQLDRARPSDQGYVDRQPDYTATVDHGTSKFSPVPKRVMDGSEPGDITPAAVLSGAPIDLQARTVRIYRPTKSATQSGDWHGHHWRMDWDILQKGHRWENPLMGWQSSADFMQGTHLSFKTREDAIRFAQKQGYEYFVQEPNERKIVPKSYAANFMHSPKTLKKIPTK